MNNKEQPHTVLLFVCGGPCQLSSSKQCSVDLMFHLEQFIYSVIKKKPRYFCVGPSPHYYCKMLKLTQPFVRKNAREHTP